MKLRPLAPYFAFGISACAIALLFAQRYDNLNVLRPFDYMQHWSAGLAVLNGKNPYDGKVLAFYIATATRESQTLNEPVPA